MRLAWSRSRARLYPGEEASLASVVSGFELLVRNTGSGPINEYWRTWTAAKRATQITITNHKITGTWLLCIVICELTLHTVGWWFNGWDPRGNFLLWDGGDVACALINI